MNLKNNYSETSNSKKDGIEYYEININKDVIINSNNKPNSPSILTNWKVSNTLIFIFFFSVLESYFHTLVKFNSNTIFSSFENNIKDDPNFSRDFYFIFFTRKLGTVSDNYWSSKLFKFILISFLAEKISNLLSCFFNRKLTKTLKEIISSKFVVINTVSSDKKKQTIEKIESNLLQKIGPIFKFFISFAQLAFDFWFFYYTMLEKEIKNGRLVSHLITSAFLSFFYYSLLKLVKYLLLKFSFIAENNNHQMFFKGKGIFSEEKVGFYDIFPTFFASLYFQTFVFWAIQKDSSNEIFLPFLSKFTPPLSGSTGFISLRIDSFLFAAYLGGFIKKTQNFFKSLLEMRKVDFFHHNERNFS